MAAVFDPAGHPLLSAKAAALESDNPDGFAALAAAVEESLGLAQLAELPADDAAKAATANALQLNWLLDAPAGTDRFVVERRKGDQQIKYRVKDDEREAGDPLAFTLAGAILSRHAAALASSDGWADSGFTVRR